MGLAAAMALAWSMVKALSRRTSFAQSAPPYWATSATRLKMAVAAGLDELDEELNVFTLLLLLIATLDLLLDAATTEAILDLLLNATTGATLDFEIGLDEDATLVTELDVLKAELTFELATELTLDELLLDDEELAAGAT